MFDTLSGSFQKIFKNLRGYGKLSEKNVKDALREVRLALLEADVQYEVVKDFINRVREQCLGEEVLDSVTPGQQMTKRVQDEMTRLLGETRVDFNYDPKPAGIMLLGLHGAGKTTTASKLALRMKGEGKRVRLAACDIRRPAAVDQLRILAEQVGAAFTAPEPGETVPAVGTRALREAKLQADDVIIYDTGGRFQIDEELVDELKTLRDKVEPANVVLVLDAAIGQESTGVATRFNEAVQLTGLILTKLDGDARGGAALSVQSVTGCPILLAGMGERPEDLEPFYPDRMASRILGMGDVVSFVEKAQVAVDEEETARLEKKIRRNQLNLEDFLGQIQQMKKLGPIEKVFEMLPGAPQMDAASKDRMAEQSGKEMKKSEAIIRSMTPGERKRPDIINANRKKRIAKGSGTDVRDVNMLLRKFNQTRKMAKKMKSMQKRLMRAGR